MDCVKVLNEREVYVLYKETSDFDSRVIGVYGDKTYAEQVLEQKLNNATEKEYFYINAITLPVTLDYGISECVKIDGISYAVKMPKSPAEKFLEETLGFER